MTSFDYVIVGAGSAGCALAARLAQDPACSVLLLEAGGDNRHLMIRVPLSWHAASVSPRFGWGYESEPEESTANRQLDQPRGKLMGGTSSINGMMYSRGNRGDYDGWAQMGLAGWSYEDVLPYFRRMETSWRGASHYHGDSGPVGVVGNPPNPVTYGPMIATAQALGYHENDDFHGPSQEGFGMPDFTVCKGERESSATAYLSDTAKLPNLTITTGATVTRVLRDGNAACGVEYSRGGQLHRVAAGEVILSGGAFNSPKLLLLSGIGPATELAAHGIETWQDLPQVGRNLQDHPLVPAIFRASQPLGFDSLLRLDRLALHCARWGLGKSGPLVDAPLSVQGYVRCNPASGHADPQYPDTQFQVSHVSFQARPWFPGWRKRAGDEFTAAAMQLRPHGRGSVTLRSADPAAAPCIRFGLFQHEQDREAARNMLAFMREFFATRPLADMIAAEFMPGPDVSTPEAIDGYIANTIQTSMHPTSTCAMGTDPASSVVDAQLRVHGIDRLRVVDASVMPRIVSGNTNAPTIMIAEKAADLIRNSASGAEPSSASPQALSA